MKKAFLRFLSIFVIGCLFFSCNPSTGDNYEDEEQQQQGASEETGTEKDSGEKTDKTPNINRNYGVKFDFADAQALAKLEAKQDGSRAVTNADELGDLVKILADGSMENAITVGENCSLSDIVAIYKSPLEDSKDIFIVFNGESVLGYEEVEKEYEWGGTYTDRQEIRVGQLICLHEDGSIADILKKDNPTDSWNTHMSLKTESVTFDATGNLYFISSDNGDMIYQYNPLSGELTKMVAAVEGTTYEKMQIDDEGQWIFVSGNRYTGSNSYFLRAIPISNPNSPVNVYYSSNEDISSEKWVYDNRNGLIYFIVNDGSKSGLFKASKLGGFKDKSYVHSSVGAGFDISNLFESYGFYEGSYYWKDGVKKSSGDFDSVAVVDMIISWLPCYYDYRIWDNKRLTIDDVDIRFDKWGSLDNDLSRVANLTKGKKNKEAFEVLNTQEGMSALYAVWAHNNGYFESTNGQEGYSHNLLADIIYIKDTDILLCNSEDVVFDYKEGSEEDSEIKIIRGIDFFQKYLNGNYKSSYSWDFASIIDGTDYWRTCWKFSSDYYDADGKLDTTKIIDYFFSYCNKEGVKEFNLTAFNNDKTYSSLYSTLKNGEVIDWLASDLDRMDLFRNLLGVYSDGMFYQNYSIFMNFISRTCSISDSDQKAITWNWNNEEGDDIPYEYYKWGWNGAKLSATDTGIYYEYYNTSGTDPFYYIVQVADADGKMVELVNKLPLPSGKVVKSEKNKDRILLQYSVMDENGAELGYHHIYSVEMANGLVTNCFDNVPNRNSLEVVSFNSAGDLLYYSAVRGTSVENGIVNIVTNEYNPLTVQRKMVAVYTFN